MSTIDELRGLVERATKLPWVLATSNSWRRIVSESGKAVCEPTIYSVKDPHPDMQFRNGGEDGPDATLLLAAVNTLPALLAVAEAARKVVQHTADFDLETALARLDGEVGHG